MKDCIVLHVPQVLLDLKNITSRVSLKCVLLDVVLKAMYSSRCETPAVKHMVCVEFLSQRSASHYTAVTKLAQLGHAHAWLSLHADT